MKILIEYPPNIDKIKARFPLGKGVVFTYGDTIYNPDNGRIDDPLMDHEATHTLQQGKTPEMWWTRYLVDGDFRFVQELEAYQNQYQRFCFLVKDRNARARFLFNIARDLSSPMYGGICTQQEASAAIRNKVTFNKKI